MSDFRKQILEDFEDYRTKHLHVEHLEKDDWAFNFWVLDKLFSEDESLIEEEITDYNDRGVDCFVWHEDLHDLYLIQNKFYSDGTNLAIDYIKNDFLIRALASLENGTYTRSKQLQDIYNKYHEEEDFTVYLHLYVTNNTAKTQPIVDCLEEFNEKNAAKQRIARMYSLDEIQELYYKAPKKDKKSFKFRVNTINKGTTLNINNAAYNTELAADARYVLTPVTVIYNMYKAADKQGYPLFDENIREYLGPQGAVNKKIMETLKSSSDRNNFFFYNNGITMIVDNLDSIVTDQGDCYFHVYNPQIVNGCQTVSTIYETLLSLPESRLEADFKHTYVMIKILRIPSDRQELQTLYRDIVTYNNSQNAINEKTFVAAGDIFKRLQTEFEGKGFLVCIKQSDKHKYLTNYPKVSTLLDSNERFLLKFGLKEHLKKTKDFIIDVEKLLQVFLAFISRPNDAIQNKSKLLKYGSQQNNAIVGFIKNPSVTSNDLVSLYLLYLRAEIERNESKDGKSPNPFYLINLFAKYECHGAVENISQILKNEDAINGIIRKYTMIFRQYYTQWTKNNEGKEYNDLIKSPIDELLMGSARDMVEQFLELEVNK